MPTGHEQAHEAKILNKFFHAQISESFHPLPPGTHCAMLKNGEKSDFLGHFLGVWLTLDPIFGPQMCTYGPGHGKLLCQACPGEHLGACIGVYRPTLAEKYSKNCYFQRFPTLEHNISLIDGYPADIFGTMFTPP